MGFLVAGNPAPAVFFFWPQGHKVDVKMALVTAKRCKENVFWLRIIALPNCLGNLEGCSLKPTEQGLVNVLGALPIMRLSGQNGVAL